jgi:hypothetical protein
MSVWFELAGTTRRVEVAASFVDRLLGVLAPGVEAVLLPGRSVHGFGLTRSVWAIGIDRSGSVTEVRRLRPFGLLVLPGCRWILEIPIEWKPPRLGDRLRQVGPCPVG